MEAGEPHRVVALAQEYERQRAEVTRKRTELDLGWRVLLESGPSSGERWDDEVRRHELGAKRSVCHCRGFQVAV